jgi:hypothetical protein
MQKTQEEIIDKIKQIDVNAPTEEEMNIILDYEEEGK